MINNYRIVEKDEFYIQKKSKIIGWHYVYKLEDSLPFPVISTFIVSILGIVLSIIFPKFYIILSTIFVIGLFLLSRYWYPHKFLDLDSAKRYINKEAELKEKRKQKRVIKKIHYMDIQTERKEKLENLK